MNQINVYFNDTNLNRNEVVTNMYNRTITVETIKRLDNNAPGIQKWLNDDIIEVYMQLLCDQYSSSNNILLLNTHFMDKLLDIDNNKRYTYDNVKRWTKQNVFNFDKIFIPININNCHWVLIIIFIHHKQIMYYDSNISNEDQSAFYLDTTLSWLYDENIKWNINNFRRSDWNKDLPIMPQQNNNYDCGVFLLAIAEDVFKSNTTATFTQKDIPQIRLKIAISIVEN
jgi:Ulp1 family protease